MCATAYEDSAIVLTTPSTRMFSVVKFASFGTAIGSCGSNQLDSCNSNKSVSIAQANCLGQSTCRFWTSLSDYGKDPCPGVRKYLTLELQSDLSKSIY